jgi:hypothetical protein
MHKYPLWGAGLSSGKSGSSYRRDVEAQGDGEVSPHSAKSFLTKTLSPFCDGRNLEVHTSVVVGFLCGRKVELGEQNLSRAALGELKQRVAHDGVIDYIGLMAVFENQRGRGLNGDAILWIGVGSRKAMGRPLAGRQRGRRLAGVSVGGVVVIIIIVAVWRIGNDRGNVDRFHDSDGKVAAIIVTVAAVVASGQGQAWLCREEKI